MTQVVDSSCRCDFMLYTLEFYSTSAAIVPRVVALFQLCLGEKHRARLQTFPRAPKWDSLMHVDGPFLNMMNRREGRRQITTRRGKNCLARFANVPIFFRRIFSVKSNINF